MFSWLADPAAWAAFGALSLMEIVLGIDNVIFISLLVSRLPADQAKRARALGLGMALVFRIALLFALTWIIGLKAEAFSVLGIAVSWRDIILFGGGLFLIIKATHELHAAIEGEDHIVPKEARPRAFLGAMVQIALIDLVFSVDSIITAIGMVQDLGVMVAAVVLSMLVMFAASGPIASFIGRHPTVKVLALAFLLMIGVALCVEAAGFYMPRGYIYAAIGFSLLVEGLNIAASGRKRRHLQRRSNRHEEIVQRVHARSGAQRSAEEQAGREG